VARTKTEIDDRILAIVVSPARLVLAVAFFSAAALTLGLNKTAQDFLGDLEIAAIILAFTWLLLRLVDVFAAVVSERLTSSGRVSVTTVVPLGRRTLKAVFVLLAVLAMLQNLGFNITGIVAGLGVGGLAIALAAQKSIENLFGGVTLIADQPVRVGDFCRFGDKLGTVEDVGLRSTRVRTLDRTVITVPNADFSQMPIESFAPRDRIRLFTMLGLRYETTPDQLRYVLENLRRMLLDHPMVDPDPARVRFIGFGASSLDLEVFAYVKTSDWAEFLATREDIYLRIMDVVEEAGTGFAFPSQTLYTTEDTGLDADRAAAAAKAGRALREEGWPPGSGPVDGQG
jgi:MscS family membrane protein